MKILIVEDDFILRGILAEVLSCEGYEVRVSASGNEAKEILMAEPDISLIISDYMMPNGSGGDLLEFVRFRDPAIPGFFMITGHADLSPSEFRRLGAQDCIFKPFDVDQFIEKVRAYRDEVFSSNSSKPISPARPGTN